MDDKRANQDQEYVFPYHYVPQFRGGFAQTVTWTWGRQYLSAIEFILSEISQDAKTIRSIADVGCGDGRLTRELAIEYPDKEIIGIDYSERAISLARALNPGIDFFCLDIAKDNVSRQFDALTLVEVFEHISLDDCTDFVAALAGLLNNAGCIYLTVPHKNKQVSYKHFQHFDLDRLMSYFGNYFDVEKVVYFERLSRWNLLLNWCLANRLYVLNSRGLNNMIYRLYKTYLFSADETNAGRIYLKLVKK